MFFANFNSAGTGTGIGALMDMAGNFATSVADSVRTTGMGTSFLWNAGTGLLSASTAEVQPFANQTAATGITKFVPAVTGITKFAPATPETVSTTLDTVLSYVPAMPSMSNITESLPSLDDVTSRLPSSSDIAEHATPQNAAIAASVVTGGLLLNQMRQNGVRSTIENSYSAKAAGYTSQAVGSAIAKGKSLLPSFSRSQEQSFDNRLNALLECLTETQKKAFGYIRAGGYTNPQGERVSFVDSSDEGIRNAYDQLNKALTSRNVEQVENIINQMFPRPTPVAKPSA